MRRRDERRHTKIFGDPVEYRVQRPCDVEATYAVSSAEGKVRGLKFGCSVGGRELWRVRQ